MNLIRASRIRLLTPEYAYLTDLRHQRADGDWKALRQAKAKSALETLARIAPVRSRSVSPSSTVLRTHVN